MLLFTLAVITSSNVEIIDEGLRSRVEHNLTSVSNNTEVFQYQAEISKLMHILVDSLYENKDIFLREIISNANDALDKIRFQALRKPSVLTNGSSSLEILLDVDKDMRTISITDTGIGMTKRDLIENLGRIAKSGTSDFQKMLNAGDANLIGQFGVGFYSSFLVAEKVTVISKHNNDDKQWIWQSDGSSNYTITEDPRGNTLGRGTQIILHLKPSAYQYLDRDRLVSIVRHYSMFVDFPVKIWHFHETAAELNEDDENDYQFEDDTVVSEESTEYVTFGDGQKEQKVTKTVWQWETINTKKPLWLRDPESVPESDYAEFYKGFFKESSNALHHIHFKAEGRITFSALFFIPSTAPPAHKLIEKVTRNVRLYVKRVLVSDEWEEELLPDYLHFLRGVIDSSDLTLNVDRDHLANSNTLKLIKRRVTVKILSTLRSLFQFEPGVYLSFYKNFAGNLKYGIINDAANKRALSKLLLFYTSYSPNNLVTLDDYVSRMKKNQNVIYYIGSGNRESASLSPYLEELYSKGIEVIFAVEPIDLYCLDRLEEFDGIPLENPEKAGKKGSRGIKDYQKINRFFKKIVGDRFDKVTVSSRLRETPAVCSAVDWGYTASHERLIKAQTVHDKRLVEGLVMNKKVLEVNTEHPMIEELFRRIVEDGDSEEVKEEGKVLWDTALIAGGFTVEEPMEYTKRLIRLMVRGRGVEEKVSEFEKLKQIDYKTMEDEFRFGGKNDR